MTRTGRRPAFRTPAAEAGFSAALRACPVPTLQVLAGRSRRLDPRRAAAGAAVMPSATSTVLPEATHHTIPTVDGERLARTVTDFLLR